MKSHQVLLGDDLGSIIMKEKMKRCKGHKRKIGLLVAKNVIDDLKAIDSKLV
jgi:hypothetical protein